ncbi:alpha/beta-hydrolase [Gonapodya prolifera JEL478]|uniref:Alpha/beta-hydrolase n=1 Tax=Gonapodya prolifera (strain JEL478) TaxID=1344416 RepID=A0A139AHV2_GONPJ|nr:alpha/beta-hydrolase [Gonapodya prolifera JEL478]|eukprot:KXS16377.1 alpha/beta-hydrolase [Gonapodya prolifera JEL478]
MSTTKPFAYPRSHFPGLYAFKSSLSASESSALAEDALPGSAYAELTLGRTHYSLFGPENGVPFVFVHGLRIPSASYKTLLLILADKGLRILTYDLYGRAYSDAPNAVYSDEFYAAQLRLLLSEVVPQWKRFHLSGLSLGGRIVTKFASVHGDKLESLTLMCPAVFLTPLPMEPGAPPPPLAPVPENAPGYDEQVAATKTIAVQQKHLPGFARAIYSTITSWDPESSTGGDVELKTIAARYPSLPVLAVWGTADSAVPFAIADKIKERVPHLELWVKEGHGHEVGLSAPDEVAEAVGGFVRRAVKGGKNAGKI